MGPRQRHARSRAKTHATPVVLFSVLGFLLVAGIAFGIGMAPNTNVDYTTLMDSVDAPEAKLLVSACQLCMAADYQALGLGNEFGDFEGEIQSKYAGLKDGSKTVDDVVKDLDAVIAAN